MKKTIENLKLIAFAAIVLLFVSCNEEPEKLEINPLSSVVDSMSNELLSTSEELNASRTYLEEITNELEAMMDDDVLFYSSLADIEQEDDKVMSRLELLGDLLSEYRTKLEKTEVRLGAADKKRTEMIKEINGLLEMVAEQEVQIANAHDELFEVCRRSEMTSEQLAQTMSILKFREDQMNVAYFTAGSFKELKDKGIVRRKGGVFGLGGEKILTNNPDLAQYKELDIRELDFIPLFSSKAELVSSHAEGSFEMQLIEGSLVLHILDKEAFWKRDRYLTVVLS